MLFHVFSSYDGQTKNGRFLSVQSYDDRLSFFFWHFSLAHAVLSSSLKFQTTTIDGAVSRCLCLMLKHRFAQRRADSRKKRKKSTDLGFLLFEGSSSVTLLSFESILNKQGFRSRRSVVWIKRKGSTNRPKSPMSVNGNVSRGSSVASSTSIQTAGGSHLQGWFPSLRCNRCHAQISIVAFVGTCDCMFCSSKFHAS
jgi:hypothetical protein